jgi:hypothetical protein
MVDINVFIVFKITYSWRLGFSTIREVPVEEY